MPRSLPLLVILAALVLPASMTSATASAGSVPAVANPAEMRENSDRALRKRDETIRKLEKKYGRRLEACNRGETAACADANQISGEIMLLRTGR